MAAKWNQKFMFPTLRIFSVYYNSVGFVRNYRKHYNPKFRSLRGKKFEAGRPGVRLGEEEKLLYGKKCAGLTPSSYTSNIPHYITSTLSIFDPYIPKQGDGKYSSLLKKTTENIKSYTAEASRNSFHSQRIKRFDRDFSKKEFAHLAQEIYINAHEALVSKNENELLKYTTEKAFNLMSDNFKNKTIRWKYIESLDPPTTVQIRTGELSTKGNLFGQVTVRIHSKQMLAIYDRFGRLMYGSEILAKDVLEYVVFERHLVNLYGTWKLHDKIIPDWIAPNEPVPRTYVEIVEKDAEEVLDDEFNLRSNIIPESEEAEAEAEAEKK